MDVEKKILEKGIKVVNAIKKIKHLFPQVIDVKLFYDDDGLYVNDKLVVVLLVREDINLNKLESIFNFRFDVTSSQKWFNRITDIRSLDPVQESIMGGDDLLKLFLTERVIRKVLANYFNEKTCVVVCDA